MGSNMAECHPVGFQWVVEARQRGATVIHVDPRFTRTSALADLHVPLRAGSDIVFLGAVVNHILQNQRDFREYVLAYTNASTIVEEGFRDTEDLDGLFSGWDPERRAYDSATWQYEGARMGAAAGDRTIADRSGSPATEVRRDPTLQHPRCVYQLLEKHFRRYTPELVEEACGVPRDAFLAVAETLCGSSGRERTAAICYAVGWTQHTVGVQYIRTAAIIQLLLGNMGRPGGGILALRGHANIQGATDIPTLFDLLPGYLPMRHAARHPDLQTYVRTASAETGYWGHMDAYAVSLLKAWFGDHATPENDFGFDLLPRIDGNHSTYPSVLGMKDGSVHGFFLLGENPAVGSAHSGLHREAMRNLRWLVVRDLVDIESASVWQAAPEESPVEVFFLPAASHVEKDGSFTNTQRMLQWHEKAVEPPGDCTSDLWFFAHLGRMLKERVARSRRRRDRAIQALTWDYVVDESGEPSAEAVLREVNGRGAGGEPLSAFTQLKADGSTACGCWVYCGCFAGGENQTARRRPGAEQTWVAPEWGWAWPANRRLLYNRASADPDGRPWSERKAYVWWDERKGEWAGHDVPDFPKAKRPDYEPPPGAVAEDALRGDEPFIMQSDGRGWLYAPNGLADGPLPAHYEPQESPFENALYGQQCNPARTLFIRPDNPYNGVRDYPYVMTTYRLTEHHTAGGMSRFLPYLSELQPEMFCEVSPELAAERGLTHGDWATIISTRTKIEARVLVTDRLKPLRVQGQWLHQVGLPYHWGAKGIARGDSANDLFPLVLDPNVHIQEVKAATCDIQPGRIRRRGPGRG
jgi:formate dehydrogenase major subunit